MKEIIALQEYTDKYISLYEGQIRNIEDRLAEKLIEQGIVAEHSDNSDQTGGSGNGVRIVTLSYDDNGNILMDENEASVQTSILNGESIIFKLTYESTSTWYYPTEIDNGSIIMFSLIHRLGNTSIDILKSDGNGSLSWIPIPLGND